MTDDTKQEIPFTLKLYQAAQVIGIGVGELKTLVRSKEIEVLNDSSGPKIPTESVIRYLGRERFKKRWPLGLGEVKFEEERGELVSPKKKVRDGDRKK